MAREPVGEIGFSQGKGGGRLNLMSALVITGAGACSVRQVEIPVPGPGQVRIRMEGSGLCASDLPVWEGRPWFEYPRESGAPGHEGWGRVDETGSGVEDLSKGDRVAVLSYHAYAEYDVADRRSVVKLPRELDGMPFPAEPLACAVNVLERSGIASGDTVAVVGIGFLGALLTALAASRGARVIALSRRGAALDAARTMGASFTIPMDDHRKAVESVRAIAGPDGCDCAIEAAGRQWPLDLASDLVKTRGRLVIAGFHQDGPRQVNMQNWNWKGIDVINAHERDPAVYIRGMEKAVELVRNRTIDPSPLFTHGVPLDDFAKAAALMRDRPEGFMKALVGV